MKSITTKSCMALFALTALAGTAQAAKIGAYAGLGLGPSLLETPNQYLGVPHEDATTSLSQSRSRTGLGGRLFAGYNFSEYLGIEAGFTQFARAKYSSSASYLGGAVNLNESVEYKMNALDVVAKIYLPFGQENSFSLYGLGGVALVHNTNTATGSANAFNNSVQGSASETQNKIRPVAGVGVSYDIPQTTLTTGLEYRHVQGMGNVKTSINAIPSADIATFNLSYNLG